ncbi:hypothetical protein HDV00_000548 [Rhizophlyctis rosea]|nr:hypothetical protein HDV00_000548 [Rhizophlyctis rosea]
MQANAFNRNENVGHLPLPSKYVKLEEIFAAMEQTLAIVARRTQQCVFHKIKKMVETICERTFELRHLEQILSVYPDAYICGPTDTVFEGLRTKSWSIERSQKIPATEASLTAPHGSEHVVSSIMSGGIYGAPIVKTLDNMALQKQASEERHRRQEEFYQRLLARVTREYEKNGKENVTSSYDSNTWDPKFILQDVPDIERIDLESLWDMTTAEEESCTDPAARIETGHRVFIENFGMEITDDELRLYCEQAGRVLKVFIQRCDGVSLQYGFTTYENEEDAKLAVAVILLNKSTLRGRLISVRGVLLDATFVDGENDPIRQSPVKEIVIDPAKEYPGCRTLLFFLQ